MSKKSDSVLLSYILRHAPQKAKTTLDTEGWCELAALIKNTDFTIESLREIVDTDEKGRYTMTETHIRANQGHSAQNVKMAFKKKTPPTVLYHGTSNQFVPTILKEGIKKMNRHHVHMSSDTAIAKAVGGRRGNYHVFTIDAKQMVADGIEILISDNDVWLVDFIHPKYFL